MKSKIDNYKEALFLHNLQIIKKQNAYLKNKVQVLNTKTGEVLANTATYESKQKEYVKTIEQKVNALVALANKQELQLIFMTMTLPSKFHPIKTLKSGKVIKNKNYQYIKLEYAIEDGYEELKKIYRVFYKRVKNFSKNIYFIKVVEPHKSLIPHLHVLLFVESEKLKITKHLFYKVCKEYKLQRVDFDESLLTENIQNATGYVMKYILKTLNSKDEYFRGWLSGWRKKHKIRACEMSNLPVSIEIYKKIYYNLPSEEKENIQKEIEEKNQSFFEYFIENCEVHQIIIQSKEADMDGG